MTRILRLGAVSGLAGGLAMALFLLAVGERSISDAIALEDAAARAAGETHEAVFSRGTQLAGGFAGSVLAGVVFGLVLAVVFAAVRHKLAFADDWRRAVAVSATGFVTIALVPALKYPANPPAVGDPDTIGHRTTLYVLMLAWSLVATWGAWRLSLRLRERLTPDHVRLTAAVALFAMIVGVGFVVLPGTPDAVAAPATLVWRFRTASLGGAALLWLVSGVVLGSLLERTASFSATRTKAVSSS